MGNWIPNVPESTYERMQQLADRARAQHTMSLAADHVLGYAAAHADHIADMWVPDRAAPYSLEQFLAGLVFDAHTRAADHIVGDSPSVPDLQVVIVVPDWANSARGAHAALNEPDWVRVWEPITVATVAPDAFPSVARAVAVVANGRRPSLLRVDWEWCGVFPFATPTYKAEATDDAPRVCAGTCEDTPAEAAA